MASRSSLTRGALFLLLAAGCASAPPPKPLPSWTRATEPSVAKYPKAEFITAAASSTVSSAEAVERARAAAVQQVASQIKVEIDHLASEVAGKADSQYLEKVRSTSSFAHAELIQLVEQTESGGMHYALVALDRHQAEAALAQDISADEARFRSAATRALAARKDRRAGEFTAAAEEAESVLPQIEASYVVRRALLRGRSPSEQAHAQLRNQLIDAQVAAKAARVVDVRVASGAHPALIQRAVAAVKKLGLRVNQGAGCEGKGEEAVDATELVLTPDESCGEGPFGPTCRVDIRVAARGCAGGGSGEGRIAQLKGAHTNDKSRALGKAWDKVTDQLVESAIREALSGTISGGKK